MLSILRNKDTTNFLGTCLQNWKGNTSVRAVQTEDEAVRGAQRRVSHGAENRTNT